MDATNYAYRHAFEAAELLAAACNIDMRHLHHRYYSETAVNLLRSNAAAKLRAARQYDKPTAAKVWQRHRPQVAKR